MQAPEHKVLVCTERDALVNVLQSVARDCTKHCPETRELSVICGTNLWGCTVHRHHFLSCSVRIFTVLAQNIKLCFVVEASCCEPMILWAKEPLQHRYHVTLIVSTELREYVVQF